MKVLLVALNSQYVHTNLAVRYLKSYTADLDVDVSIREFTINDREEKITTEIMRLEADVICFSTYIWNVEMVSRISNRIKTINPIIKILYGGPEVSYDAEEFLSSSCGDFLIEGEGEESFREFLLELNKNDYEALKNIRGLYSKIDGSIYTGGRRILMNMNNIVFPYKEDEDLENKIVYYEASRGCPFNCSYCLSSTTHGVRFLDIPRVKRELQFFIDKKVSLIKFVDRTFNCNHKFAMEIWSFLKENGCDTRFHFEISADLLSTEEIDLLKEVKDDMFQFEVGVQTTNDTVLNNINRFVNFSSIEEKVVELLKYKNIKQHLDLIAGLPGENLESFKKSFNDLFSLRPEEIQLGFLKLLKGSQIRNESEKWGIVAMPYPPYEVVRTKDISYKELLELKSVEEMVDRYYNSGKFRHSIDEILRHFESPYEMFLNLSTKYKELGFFDRSISNTDYYYCLEQFAKEIETIDHELFLNILKHEYLLFNKKRWLPLFLNRIELSKKEEQEIRKQYEKRDHIEVFNRDLESHLENTNEREGIFIAVYSENGDVTWCKKDNL